MSGGQESFPPGSGPQPPFVPTQEDPTKPLGPDPVSPTPQPEGSETARHAQLFGYDAATKTFKPVSWDSGSLVVSFDAFLPVLDTLITRDLVSGLVSQIAETDGMRTKNTFFTRNPPSTGRVVLIHEVLV